MAKQGITTGSAPNDGTGDTLLNGAVKINSNFDELYTYLGNGSNLNYIGGRWANTSVGISTISNVGIGTTNPTSALTVTGDTKIVGVLTANTFIGNVTGNLTGNVTGTATTASVSGGLTGTPTISVTDVNASGKVSAGGSVTGATIHGNGNALSGIVTYINAGTNISVSANQGYVTVNATAGGGQGYFTKNATGINTTSNIGIGTTTATSALTVSGHGKFTGIVTASQFVGALTGNAATAAALQNARTIGGVSFDGTSNINLPGVNASGNQNTSGNAATATVATNAQGLTGTPNISVSAVSAAATVTAAKFVGDGSGLTGVTASGTGIIIKNDGSTVGTAGTINFATNLSVSAISGAAVTVTGATDNNPNVATLVVAGVTTATGNVSIGSSLLLGQSKKALFTGGSGKLEIYRDGSNSFITDSGAGDFYIQGAYVRIRNAAGTEQIANFLQNGGTTLYHNDSLKFATDIHGVTITGVTSTTTLEVNERYGVSTGFGTFVASAGVAHTVDTFNISSNNFKSSEYTVHIERENTQQVQKVLVMQNGSTAYSSEYGIIYNPSLIVSIGATVASGVMKLEVTPETGQTGLTTYRFTRETMK